MTWKISGQSIEFCSCRMFCPCWFGPDGEPDQGWCSDALGFDIREGSSNGVDLGGTSVVLAFDWPGNFFHGDGKGRVYIGEGANADQRRELEAIFMGRKGGVPGAVLAPAVAEWLPAQATKIDIAWGKTPSVTVGKVGQGRLNPVTDGGGNPTMLDGAMAQSAFQLEDFNLASGKGSRWSDPDLRSWDGDSATLHRFAWTG